MSAVISQKKYASLLAKRLLRVTQSDGEYGRMITDVQELMARGAKLSVEEKELLKLMVLLVGRSSEGFIEPNRHLR
jgi:hypothetical protein